MRPGIKAKSTAPWKTTTLGQVLKWSSGGTPKSTMERYYNGGIPWAIIGDLNDGIVTETAKTISEEGLKNSSAKWVEEGSVLIAMYGSIGKLGIAGRRMTTNQAIAFTKPECCSATYLFWYLYYSRAALLGLGKGGTQANISQTVLKAFPFVLPSEDEQRRIVGEIEKQFSRLEEGVEALKRVQVNLKRYRAAVLKAACEGRLVPTEAERQRSKGRGARGGGKYETGAELLARILAERRKNWQGRGKYKEPAAPDTSKLGKLPEGWTCSVLDALAEIKGGITKDQNRKHTAPSRSVPYLRVANVQRGYLDLTEVKEIVTTEDEIRELALKPGDILFNEGGDRDKLGRGWAWNGEIPECIHQNHVFRARRYDAALNPKFVSWYANTYGQQFFFDQGKHTTNLASISMSKIKGLPVPIPPPSEQSRIVAEVERRLSVVEEMEATVEANLQRATRLRQSILQKAFEGELL